MRHRSGIGPNYFMRLVVLGLFPPAGGWAETCPPISAQEGQTWQRSPLTAAPKVGFQCWSDDITGKVRPEAPWRRDNKNVGYPYIGPYTDGDPLVFDWQVGQAKNCGLATFFINLICEYNQGRDFINESDFAKILDRAELRNYPVAVMDDSYFRNQAAQSPENVVPRISAFLKKYGNRKGFYKIEGKPVYLLDQRFDFLTNAQIEKMLREIEANFGGAVYWVLADRWESERLAKIPAVKALRGASSTCGPGKAGNIVSLLNDHDGNFDLEGISAEQRRMVKFCHANGKKAWTWIYPAFDNRGSWGGQNITHGRMDDRYGQVLTDLLEISKKNKADHIVISSWNCYLENTQIEASWDFDGYRGDPFARQKIIAQAAGKAWKNPPPPDPSIVDPILFGKVFGKDGIGPEIRGIRVENGDLEVFVVDDESKVAKVQLWINGSVYLLAAKDGLRLKGLTLPTPKPEFATGQGIPAVTVAGDLKITKSLPAVNEAWVISLALPAGKEMPEFVPPTSPMTFHWERPEGTPVFAGVLWEKMLLQDRVVLCASQPVWHFSLMDSQSIRAKGLFHYLALIHPSDPDLVLDRPIETAAQGRSVVYRTPLPTGIKIQDILIAVSIDEHGNRGEPLFKQVQYLR